MKTAAGSREQANQAHPIPAEQPYLSTLHGLDAILPSGPFKQPPCFPAWQFTKGRFAFTHAQDRQPISAATWSSFSVVGVHRLGREL